MTGHNKRKLSTPLTKALRSGALRREAKRGISKRRTRAIGRGLCLGIVIATITQLNAYSLTNIDHYKLYLHSKLISEKQYKCAYYVAHIESRWNPLAHNAGHYGLFQMKNDKVKYLNAYQQIDMWLRYVAHRYDNKPCKAMSHLKIRNWQ